MPASSTSCLLASLLALGAGCPALHALATETESETDALPAAVRVPLEFRRGAALVQARANDSHLLTFKLDAGFGVTTIHPSLAESLGLRRVGKLTINGIAGEETAAWLSGATFDFGGVTYTPRLVATIPSDA